MRVTFDDEIEYWRVEIPQGEGMVHVTVADSYSEDEVESVARRGLERVEAKWEDIQQNIINALLDRYNREYNEDKAMESEVFIGHFAIELLSVEEDGELEIYFDDDNLFKDKWVSLEMESDDNLPMQAELIG